MAAEGGSSADFVVSNHVARYRVSELERQAYSEQTLEDCLDDHRLKEIDGEHWGSDIIEASDNFRISHNGISLEFKSFLIISLRLDPRLRLVQASHDHIYYVPLKWELSVLSEDVDHKPITTSVCQETKTLKKGDKELELRGCHDQITTLLPLTAIELSEKGYLTDGGMTLALKYRLEIPRHIFENKNVPIYSHGAANLPNREPSDVDVLEYEELNMEVQSDNRFVLESADGDRFCAHKNRLILASEYFKGMLHLKPELPKYGEVSNGELKMADVSTATLKQLLAFIYLGNINEDTELDIVELAKAADKYLVSKLKSNCYSRLLQFTNFYEMTAAEVVNYLRVSYLMEMRELKKTCMQWLYERWDTVKEEHSIKKLLDDEEGRRIMFEFVDYLTQKG